MKTCLLMCVTVLSIFLMTGCGGRYRLPGGAPGTIYEQRNRATIHDPFPEPEIGPEVVGGRPPAFDRPLPEAKRNPLYRDIYGSR